MDPRDGWQTATDIAQVVTAVGAITVPVVIGGLAYVRRPSVSIHEDKERIHSHLEGTDNDWPHIRLLVANKGWRRAAHGTQVIVVGYRRAGEPANQMRTIGTPPLGWPTAQPVGARLTIFPGMSRPFDFGSLYPAMTKDGKLVPWRINPPPPPAIPMPQNQEVERGGRWHFRLGIESTIADYREYIPPGAWIVRLVVGADDGSASTYDVHLSWKGDEPDAKAALDYLLDHLAVSGV